jgi:hypothetical protein
MIFLNYNRQYRHYEIVFDGTILSVVCNSSFLYREQRHQRRLCSKKVDAVVVRRQTTSPKFLGAASRPSPSVRSNLAKTYGSYSSGA